MAGVSIGPFVGSLFEDFTTSFIVALAIFGMALTYLFILQQHKFDLHRVTETSQGLSIDTDIPSSKSNSLLVVLSVTLSPLRLFHQYPASIPSGLSLLIYNCVQSYTFIALMIHTSLLFGFTGRQNGYLIAIVHLVAALYLIIVLFIVPYVSKTLKKTRGRLDCKKQKRLGEPPESKDTSATSFSNAVLALVSLALQSLSLMLLALMKLPWQAYSVACLLALGLAAHSFIKSHFI